VLVAVMCLHRSTSHVLQDDRNTPITFPEEPHSADEAKTPRRIRNTAKPGRLHYVMCDMMMMVVVLHTGRVS
jgi:hypothetical protein